MRRFFNGLVLGIIASAAGFWLVQVKALQQPGARQVYQQDIVKARDALTEAAENSADAMNTKFDALDLRTNQIAAELAKKGEIIRRKPLDIGEAAVDADSDGRAAAEIKARYAADARLSAWNISATCAQGHVTLIGTVPSAEDIGRAIAIALEPDGVRDVTSTLQIKPI